jgi:hypothetical protein
VGSAARSEPHTACAHRPTELAALVSETAGTHLEIGRLAARRLDRDDRSCVDAPIDHRDVTTIMGLLGDVKADVRRIRLFRKNEDAEEEKGAWEPDR